jgi:hypothetical protein
LRPSIRLHGDSAIGVETAVSEGSLPAWWRPGVGRLSDSRFLEETRDDAWATATEARIYEALSRLETGAGSIQAECRTTVCWVQVVNNSCPSAANGGPVDERLREILGLVNLLQGATGYGATFSCGDPLEGFAVSIDRNIPADPITATPASPPAGVQ